MSVLNHEYFYTLLEEYIFVFQRREEGDFTFLKELCKKIENLDIQILDLFLIFSNLILSLHEQYNDIQHYNKENVTKIKLCIINILVS